MIRIPMTVETGGALRMEVAAAYSVGGEIYAGGYEFTPGDEDMTVRTENKVLTQDIVVRAVPSNYGKVAWDGSTLTIS